jgi:hypothetical protein
VRCRRGGTGEVDEHVDVWQQLCGFGEHGRFAAAATEPAYDHDFWIIGRECGYLAAHPPLDTGDSNS